MNQAQDSTQFCIAATLLGRPMSSLRTVMEEFADPEVSELTQRVELVSDIGRSLRPRGGVPARRHRHRWRGGLDGSSGAQYKKCQPSCTT